MLQLPGSSAGTDTPIDVESPDLSPNSRRGSGDRRRKWVIELLRTFLPVLLLVFLIQTFLAQATRVESLSMEPTLFEDQRLIIEKITFDFRTPQRGDIIVFHPPEGGKIPLIKRVIGLPGETIAIHEGRVFIDGQALSEPYLRTLTHGRYPPTPIPAESYFVMGDNRDHSHDSRSFGAIPKTSIIGKAWLRYWPLQQVRLF
ncbi:MAG: signal peptidase I [Chloroflexi bacterium]|nr:signal peptidase I [Chloroflexota bacterium]